VGKGFFANEYKSLSETAEIQYMDVKYFDLHGTQTLDEVHLLRVRGTDSLDLRATAWNMLDVILYRAADSSGYRAVDTIKFQLDSLITPREIRLDSLGLH
jgi:hypothetical protein